jgi:RHS repeat-associated protein
MGTSPEYFMGAALGSVRQMTDATGAITYASSYDPYGNVVQTGDASQTAYGYTSEYTSQGLVYLRSRMYSPATGRFLTKDSWQGDSIRPQSLNRWMYTEGNPVNYTDPSGNYRKLPDWCQMMPTKWLYENCVLRKYKLEPISIFEMGRTVQGQPGCYSGPTAYRAPGYLEGVEAHIGGIPSYTTGLEVVYDFANMQSAGFKFMGININDGLVGAGASIYFGKALGLRSDTRLIEDYKDVSISGSVGGSFDIVVGGAIGRGSFLAASSNTIPMLRGKTWYIGLSLSGDLIESLDLSGSWVTYTPISSQPERYVLADKTVDTARLYSDISNGVGSPWGPQQLDLLLNNPGSFVAKSAVRAYGLSLARTYVAAYNELHNENP